MPKRSQLNPTQKLVLGINIVVRMIAPLWIFVNPWQAALLSLLTDLIDHEPLVRWQKIPRRIYQLQDKLLDFYWYILVVIFANTSITSTTAITLINIFFVYRLLGQILFMKNKDENMFLIFPNLAEPFFWLWLLAPDIFQNTFMLAISSLIIIILKIWQEYYIHTAKANLLNTILGKLKQSRLHTS